MKIIERVAKLNGRYCKIIVHSIVLITVFVSACFPASNAVAYARDKETLTQLNGKKQEVYQPQKVTKYLKDLPNTKTEYFPALKANFQEENRSLQCISLTDSTCDNTPARTVSFSAETNTDWPNYASVSNVIGINCTGDACNDLSVYYSITCNGEWQEGFYGSHTRTVHGNLSVYIGTNILFDDTVVGCGENTRSGSCSMNLSGAISSTELNGIRSVSANGRFPIEFAGPNKMSCDFSWSVDPILLDESSLSTNQPKNGVGDPRECEINGCSNGLTRTGDPIDPRTGNFDFSAVDLSQPTNAGPLTFQRTYASAQIDTWPTQAS